MNSLVTDFKENLSDHVEIIEFNNESPMNGWIHLDESSNSFCVFKVVNNAGIYTGNDVWIEASTWKFYCFKCDPTFQENLICLNK